MYFFLWYKTNVQLGDNSSRSVTVQRATFGQVKDMEGRLFPGIDGILGLAFGSTAPNGAEPVFETAIRDRAVNAGIFTIWLEDQFATSDCGTHGVIYYGSLLFHILLEIDLRLRPSAL